MDIHVFPDSFPFDRTIFAPPPQYREARESGALAQIRWWDNRQVWLATTYDHVRTILADNRFSADRREPGYPAVSKDQDEARKYVKPWFIELDPPDHTRLRRQLTAEFTFARVMAMRGMIVKLVDKLVDNLLAAPQPADYFQIFALPLPSIVITELLGIPEIDHDFFQSRANTRISLYASAEVAVQATNEMRGYLMDLIKEKAKAPEKYDDIMGRMILNYVNTGELSPEECVTSVDLMLIAGHETTANMATLGLLSILQHPETAERMRKEPSQQLYRKAVEEMLRFHSILQFVGARVALEDVEVAGVTIRKGEGVLAMINEANRDPAQFSDPNTFDVTRNMSQHIAFGFGVHQCLGQALARLELEIAFETLMRRIPTLRLAIPVEELKFRGTHLVTGLHELPVEW